MMLPHGAVFPPAHYRHSYAHFYTWRLIRDIGMWCFVMSGAANLLPPTAWFRRWPRTHYVYEVLVFVCAFMAFNWRRNLPALDIPVLAGYRLTASWVKRKHATINQRRKVNRISR